MNIFGAVIKLIIRVKDDGTNFWGCPVTFVVKIRQHPYSNFHCEQCSHWSILHMEIGDGRERRWHQEAGQRASLQCEGEIKHGGGPRNSTT